MKDSLHFKPSLQLVRSFVYSFCICFVFVLLLNIQLISDSNLFGTIAFIGFLVAILEAYYTSKYLNLGREEKHKFKFSDHLLNHLYYPLLTFFALAFYFLIQENFALSYTLISISFFLFWAYLYYIPIHIHYDHFDSENAKKFLPKVDFALHLFKFFSYFILNLTLFTYFFYSKVPFIFVVYSNFAINFLFLLLHLFRKKEINYLNVFIAFLFAVITSFFTLTFNSSYINLSASIALLFFYLSSSIFYHKVDGTFNYRILLEYGSIGLIVSILLFSL